VATADDGIRKMAEMPTDKVMRPSMRKSLHQVSLLNQRNGKKSKG
jgi:hypothetical protein